MHFRKGELNAEFSVSTNPLFMHSTDFKCCLLVFFSLSNTPFSLHCFIQKGATTYFFLKTMASQVAHWYKRVKGIFQPQKYL